MCKTNRRLVLIIGAILFQTSVLACSCSRVGILKEQKGSDLVFVGQVIAINELKTTEKITGSDNEIEYRRYEFIFDIKSAYKGKESALSKNTVTIVSTGDEVNCGRWFEKNQKYLVYSYQSDKKLGTGIDDQATDLFFTTSYCTRTKKVNPLVLLERLALRLT